MAMFCRITKFVPVPTQNFGFGYFLASLATFYLPFGYFCLRRPGNTDHCGCDIIVIIAMEYTELDLKYPLNDGNFIPALGLGVYRSSADNVGGTERSVSLALQQGYRMIDTAEMYK